MNQVFTQPIEVIDNVDLERPLHNAKTRVCQYYTSQFAAEARSADSDGNPAAHSCFRLLHIVCSFYPNFGDPSDPYRPMWTGEGRRALIPDDLHEHDYLAIRRMSLKVKDAALRGRLYDLLWLREHNHNDCRQAADAYLAAAITLDNDENWVFAVDHYYRALQLAKRLGRKQASYARAATALLAAIERDKDNDNGFRTCQLLSVAYHFRCGDASELARVAGQIGIRAEVEKDRRRAREYFEHQADFCKLAKDEDGALVADIRAAETYISEAEERAVEPAGSYLAAATFMKQGIEALRRTRADPTRLQALKSKLAVFQKRSLAEMAKFETSVDISRIVAGARNHVKGKSLFNALQCLAFGTRLVEVSSLRENVINAVNEFPLQHLFDISLVDDKGRSTAEKRGVLNLEGIEAEQALEAEMFAHLAQFEWSIRASGFIHPARIQILNEHHPRMEELAFLVRHNPFIPAGHEGIYLRGIHAGIHGDFLVAAHLLAPQVENSLRYVLESNEVDISILNSDGTQPVKMLGALLGMAETIEFFGESLCFELRGLLIEKTGGDFRNRVAHGFVSVNECYSEESIVLWWIVLRICLIPLIQQRARDKSDKSRKKRSVPESPDLANSQLPTY